MPRRHICIHRRFRVTPLLFSREKWTLTEKLGRWRKSEVKSEVKQDPSLAGTTSILTRHRACLRLVAILAQPCLHLLGFIVCHSRLLAQSRSVFFSRSVARCHRSSAKERAGIDISLKQWRHQRGVTSGRRRVADDGRTRR